MEAVRQLCENLPGSTLRPRLSPKKYLPFLFPLKTTASVCLFIETGHRPKGHQSCVQAGILYESAQYHNAVFVGKDDQGVPRYAFLRGTYTRGKPFKAEVSGSDKSYCFCLPPCGTSRRVAVYEAAIETLAHLTLEKTADKYRLSLGGIYAPVEGVESRVFKPPTALESFLAHHPEITEIEICTTTTLQAAGPGNTWQSTTKASTRSREPTSPGGDGFRRPGQTTGRPPSDRPKSIIWRSS